MELSKIIKQQILRQDKRIKLDIEKYIELMTINRCVAPLSKHAVTRWFDTTSYKAMKGFSELDMDVTYFYRSMDYLLKAKDAIELALFKKLRNLFSINVKLTFYDITSTYFYSSNCPISADGYSRDNRPDREQIVIGVVTSYEGYPIKHFVFTGNTKDDTTVEEVVSTLKADYHIEETTFVGDRGMITKLNIEKIGKEGFSYIMGVKSNQDEICQMIFAENRITNEEALQYKNLKATILGTASNIDKKESYKIFTLIKKYTGKFEDELRFVVCLNEDIKKIQTNRRREYITKLSKELDTVFSSGNKDKKIFEIEKSINKTFEGYLSKYRKFFRILREDGSTRAIGYEKRQNLLANEEHKDGIFILLSDRDDLPISKIVESYKNLKEVESLFDDLKNFVDVRPVRHWLETRVRAHVFICILSLLLKRIFELNYLKSKSVTASLEEISKVKLVKYKVMFSKREQRSQILSKVTNITEEQKKLFEMIGIKNPMNLDDFLWC